METQRIEMVEDFSEFIDSVIDQADTLGASDIHWEPHKGEFQIRFRIDGDMYKAYSINMDNKDNIITKIKIVSGMKIDETRRPQDGEFVYEDTNSEADIDVRVSSFPIVHGEKIVMRLLRKDSDLLNIQSLGFMQYNLKLIKKSLNLKEGLILVSGATGSGKTTSLYAMLNSFDPIEYNISTLENPIEYKLPGINQSQVRHDIGYDFAKGLKTLLRQDPDIILVGEIRDHETAKLAVEASMTGHLVLGTIHANKGAGVVERMLNMGIEPYLLASSLKLVLYQRLVKQLCQRCSTSKKLTGSETDILKKGLGDIYGSMKDNINISKPTGCKKCFDTGHKGRFGIHEVAYIDEDFQDLIRHEVSSSKWENLCNKKGFFTLYQDALLKACHGYISLDSALQIKGE